MSRQTPLVGVVMTVVLAALTGCQPQQPFYLKHVDGDLAHYKGVATEIEYPDVDADRLADVSEAQAAVLAAEQRTRRNIWDLTLEEAMQIALTNNKVMRNIGGQVQGPPDFLLRNPEVAPTIYDPALAESNPRTGTEAALSAFDAQFSSSLTWEKLDTPQNVNPDLYAGIFPNVYRARHGHVPGPVVEGDGHRRHVLLDAQRRLRQGPIHYPTRRTPIRPTGT